MKKILIALIAVVFATQATAKESAPEHVEGATTVNIEEIFTLIEEKEDFVIIDARGEKDWNAGHLENAVRIKNTDVTSETLAAAIPTKGTPVMFYCNGPKCERSSDAAKKSIELGYTNVYYFFGGIAAWKEEGLPLVTSE